MPQSVDPEKKLERTMERYESRVVRHLNVEFTRSATLGNRFSDAVAARVGSWPFIIWQSGLLAVWMVWNSIQATAGLHFDPPPFIGLNLLLSFQAAYTAPFIMMSANRQARREHLEAEIDYAINYKAEEEVADMQADLHRIHRDLAAMRDENRELKQMLAELLQRS